MNRSLAVIGVALLFAVSSARGDLILEALGDPIQGGSWHQDFRLTASYFQIPGGSPFKGLGVVLTLQDGNTPIPDRLYEGFEVGPALDFSEPWATEGWSEDLVVPGPDFGHTARAAGVPTNELIWRSHFRDDPDTQAFTMTLFTYDLITDLFPTGSTAAFWTGAEWGFDTAPGVTWEEYQAITTPAPSGVLLCTMGLGLAVLIKRRFA